MLLYMLAGWRLESPSNPEPFMSKFVHVYSPEGTLVGSYGSLELALSSMFRRIGDPATDDVSKWPLPRR